LSNHQIFRKFSWREAGWIARLSTSSAHAHRDAVHHVVAIAPWVPGHGEGLCNAFAVSGAGPDLVIAGRWKLDVRAPVLPGARVDGRVELGPLPSGAEIDRDVQRVNGSIARPSMAANLCLALDVGVVLREGNDRLYGHPFHDNEVFGRDLLARRYRPVRKPIRG